MKSEWKAVHLRTTRPRVAPGRREVCIAGTSPGPLRTVRPNKDSPPDVDGLRRWDISYNRGQRDLEGSPRTGLVELHPRLLQEPCASYRGTTFPYACLDYACLDTWLNHAGDAPLDVAEAPEPHQGFPASTPIASSSESASAVVTQMSNQRTVLEERPGKTTIKRRETKPPAVGAGFAYSRHFSLAPNCQIVYTWLIALRRSARRESSMIQP
jgi:hypothetical protein